MAYVDFLMKLSNSTKRDYVKVFINERRYLPQSARRRIGRSSRRIEGCFADVAKAMARRFDLSVMIMGCTEIPLALRAVQGMDALELVDPAALLARVLARRAYGLPAEGAEPARVAGDE